MDVTHIDKVSAAAKAVGPRRRLVLQGLAMTAVAVLPGPGRVDAASLQRPLRGFNGRKVFVDEPDSIRVRFRDLTETYSFETDWEELVITKGGAVIYCQPHPASQRGAK
jgi:hypothetical protein